MKSKVLIRIIKENKVQGKTVISEECITDLYVYTKTPKMNLLFRKDTNKLYTVDDTNKKLVEIQKNNQQIVQLTQLKGMLSSVDIKESANGESKNYLVEGKGDNISLNVKLATLVIEELSQTAHSNLYNLSQATSLFELKLSSNELIEMSSTSIDIHGNKMLTNSKVTEVNIITDNINEYDYLYSYQY